MLADIERVLGDQLADMCFTDSPYNVDYANSPKDKLRGKHRPILNDNLGSGFEVFYQAQLIRELAVRHVASWTGVELNGGPARSTHENVAAVMELYPVGERFFQEFTLRQVLLNAAKNGCGPSAAGTSSPAEGPNTAGPATTTACPAPEASLEPTDSSAPTASTP